MLCCGGREKEDEEEEEEKTVFGQRRLCRASVEIRVDVRRS